MRRTLRESTETVLARIPARMIDLAVAGGLDRKELVDAAGLGGIDLTDGDARVPITTQIALWQLIAKRRPNSNFGLRAGASFKVREAGLLGYVVAHSPTLEAALERLVRYSWVLNDAAPNSKLRGLRQHANNPITLAVERKLLIRDLGVASEMRSPVTLAYQGYVLVSGLLFVRHERPPDNGTNAGDREKRRRDDGGSYALRLALPRHIDFVLNYHRHVAN